MEVTPLTQKFVDALNQRFEGKETIFGAIKFDVLPDEKYDKITTAKWDGSPHGAAHAFIERATGNLFKAASWKYPSSEARFNISDEEVFTAAIAISDPYGMYLVTGNPYKSYTDPYGNEVHKNELLDKNYKTSPITSFK